MTRLLTSDADSSRSSAARSLRPRRSSPALSSCRSFSAEFVCIRTYGLMRTSIRRDIEPMLPPACHRREPTCARSASRSRSHHRRGCRQSISRSRRTALRDTRRTGSSLHSRSEASPRRLASSTRADLPPRSANNHKRSNRSAPRAENRSRSGRRKPRPLLRREGRQRLIRPPKALLVRGIPFRRESTVEERRGERIHTENFEPSLGRVVGSAERRLHQPITGVFAVKVILGLLHLDQPVSLFPR